MNFALNEEQQEFKDRARAFARDVIRPAARKHDEEESTPWEVIREARKQGFQGLEAIQRSASDADGQMQVISAEEFHWGCAGIALAISGSGLAAAGIASSGTPEQIAQWVPECFGAGDEVKLGALLRIDVISRRTNERAALRGIKFRYSLKQWIQMNMRNMGIE